MNKLLIILFLIPFSSFSQELADTTYGKVYRNSYCVGIHFNTSGWGFYGEYAKQKNYKYKRTIGLHVSNIHHKNEFKVVAGVTESRSYYYKKINSFLVFRPSYGGNYRLFESIRESGIEVRFKWKIGPSIGLLKPVYLEIQKPQNIGTSVEKYNPEIHENGIVQGKASWFRGLSDSKIELGAFSKMGLNFNFAKNKGSISGGEIGFLVDYYPQKIELMYGVKNFNVFGALYLQFEFGSKF